MERSQQAVGQQLAIGENISQANSKSSEGKSGEGKSIDESKQMRERGQKAIVASSKQGQW